MYFGCIYSLYFRSLSASDMQAIDHCSDEQIGSKKCLIYLERRKPLFFLSFHMWWLLISKLKAENKWRQFLNFSLYFLCCMNILALNISWKTFSLSFPRFCKQIIFGLQVALLSQKLNRRRRWKTVHHEKVWISVDIL